MTLEPRYYLECPLGLDSMCEPAERYHRFKWHGCPNAYYCQSMCEPWYLPLFREGGRWKVELTYREPHGYTLGHYRKIMKEYGWAEAEDLVFGRWASDEPLRTLRNKFSLGYAVAVPIDWYELQILASYKHMNGLWWYAPSKSELPKDSSDERWQRLAKQG